METLEPITYLNYETQETVAVSPDNQLMAIVGRDLHIIRTSDFTEIYSDTTSARGGVFSADSRAFYCSSGGKSCRLDLSGTQVTKTTWDFGGGMVAHVVPTPNEELLFTYNHGPSSVLSVYDVAADSVLWADSLVPGGGMVTVTADGQYAFYNNPGGLIGPPSDFRLRVFDITARELVAEIPTGTEFDDSLPLMYLPTDRMEVSPDGRWLVLLDGESRVNMLLFDIEIMEFVDYVLFGASVGNLTALSQT